MGRPASDADEEMSDTLVCTSVASEPKLQLAQKNSLTDCQSQSPVQGLLHPASSSDLGDDVFRLLLSSGRLGFPTNAH